jgi:type I restriction enzyme, S subunit
MRERSAAATFQVPPEWELLPLGQLAAPQYGLSLPTSPGGNVAMLGMSHLQDGRIVATDVPMVEVSDTQLADFGLRDGDLLFNRTNSPDLVGKSAVYRLSDGGPFVFASYLVRLQVDRQKVEPDFLCFLMNSGEGRRQLRRLATPGVSQYNINPAALWEMFLVPLPELSEQQRVCRLVSVWAVAEERVRLLLRAARFMRRGLAQDLLAEKRRIADFAAHWRSALLGDLFRERDETNRPDLRLLAITADRGIIPRHEVERKDTSPEDKRPYKRIAPGDIGYNTMRMWQGVSALSGLEGIISPAYTVCVPRPGIDSEFASYLFKLPAVVNLFRRHSQGLVDDTLSLKFHHFAQIQVTLPEPDEQRAIAEVLRTADQEIALLERLLELYKRQKRGLMEKLLTGQVRVKV